MASTIICNGTVDTFTNPPTCSVSWVAVDTGLGTFDVASLDPSVIVGAFTAGAAIVFPAFAIAWAAAFVVKTLKGG